MEKTIICLANSKKPPSGRCVAGKELVDGSIGSWVRPVSSRNSREISEDERTYEEGGTAQLFDKISLELRAATPFLHQRENFEIDAAYYWERIGRASWNEIEASIDPIRGPLWINGVHTQNGENDKVPEIRLAAIPDSLLLIDIQNLTIRVFLEPGFNGGPARRRVRGQFVFCGNRYDLSVSDPVIEGEFRQRPNGQYAVGRVVACVSLAEPFYGYAFKVLASISNQQRHAGLALLS